jgi:NADPH:quinone reductase-like Zn-dependent oxidoreductase
MNALEKRIGVPLVAGVESAGTVVAAGKSEQAQALMGKLVSCMGGEMYTQYRCLNVKQCQVLPEGVSAREGASSFVNPMTALAMVETMRLENHTGLILTAAASNLGQMLNRVCLSDGIPIVNIVRKVEQEKILRNLGAKYVVNSSSDSFQSDLVAAIEATGATIGFDYIGGGPLAGQILQAIEAVSMKGQAYDRYGSAVVNQVYIGGRLDSRPVEVPTGVGLAWKLGGFLLTHFMTRIDKDLRKKMVTRVYDELTTTFASQYAREISLSEAVDKAVIQEYSAKETGKKFLINPSL